MKKKVNKSNNFKQDIQKASYQENLDKKFSHATSISDTNILFSFEFCNINQTLIMAMDKQVAKDLISKLKDINAMNISTAKQKSKKVMNMNNYKNLFSHISKARHKDVVEFYFGDQGRIFGFFDKRIFNIIAIQKNHIKTKRN